MLKINRKEQRFTRLDAPEMASVALTERYDLQEFISNSPQEFFAEMGLDLFLLGKEFQPSATVQDRIDLLAIDREGRCVIIELKRGNHKLQMLQAISYAGMISKWSAEDLLQSLNPQQREAFDDFIIDVDVEDLNREQQIVLVAEQFDYALLVGAEWLSEQFGAKVTCCRIALAVDPVTKAEYLTCSNVFPAPELAKEALARRRLPIIDSKLRWPDWKAALADVANPAVVKFFEGELSRNRECYLLKRMLRYRVNGKRRWFLAARSRNAYVWQQGRFENDVAFWRQGLSQPDEVKPVKEGQCLRMFLYTAEDFRFFHEAASVQLASAEWNEGLLEEDQEDSEVM
jgi:hypothetical protein